MRLEYLAHGSPECPLIRLFDFTPDEALRLRDLLSGIAAERTLSVAVHRLDWIEPQAGVELTFGIGGWDQGVVRIGQMAFQCNLTASGWENAAALVEPFVHGSPGYQWLISAPNEAELLLSATGDW